MERSFAPAVFEAVKKGDKITEEILRSNMCQAAYIIETAAKKFNDNKKIPLILDRGLSNHNEKLIKLDTVFDISAAGNAASVAEALKYASGKGALPVGFSCNKGRRFELESDISIVTDTGAEPITGSTRMKAGSVRKMVFNMILACVMVKLGHIYENLMINLKPTNINLKVRAISIMCDILKCEEQKTQLVILTVVDNKI